MALADRIFRNPLSESPTSPSRPSDVLLDRRQRVLKRLFDVSVASAALMLLWPLILVAAILVRVSSPGPVIYRHHRVGQGGARFDVLKLRTMYSSESAREWQITVGGDSRITPMGRRLRSAKLDELPQLLNVLRGEMSIVGWRPHVAGYPDRLTGPDAVLIQERPGITGAATLFFRDEERLLSATDDPRRHYDDVIYPLKVRMDLDYYRAWSLGRDLACCIVTALPSADRWLKVVPRIGDEAHALGDVAQKTDDATPVAAAAVETASERRPTPSGYRAVVVLPVHANGNDTAWNGVQGALSGNGSAPSDAGGRQVQLRGIVRDSGDEPDMLDKHIVIRSPAVIRIVDVGPDALAVSVGSSARHDEETRGRRSA